LRLSNSIRKGLVAFCVASVLSTVPAPSAHASTSSKAVPTSKKKKASRSKKRGQQKIDPVRAREIQDALIRENYLTGTATGKWDDKSQAAMQKYQADNGWQTKVIPDSRALIRLGLGPDHEHLLNPQTAMTTQSSTSTPAKPESSTSEPPGRDH
jgi:hypothetical protein